MKDCGILLLICGLILSAYPTQTEGHCVFENRVLDVGYHTTYPCMRVYCQPDGRLIAEGCPQDIVHRACPVGWYATSFLHDENLPFPDCCERLLCTPYQPY